MAGIVSNLRTFDDYRRAEEEFQLRKQKAMQERQGTPPAALQLTNEYQKRVAAGDQKGADLLAQFAKTVDRGVVTSPDGGYISAPGYDELLAGRKGLSSGADERAKQEQKTAFEPNREGLKKTAEENAVINAMEPKKVKEKEIETKIAALEAAPLLENLAKLNEGTIDAPYAAAFQPFLKVGGSDKATALDLMKQARLELAAPLAKQLGVNPTDKDFQASLDRIFDINATKESRAAQIQALSDRVKNRANIYNPEEVVPTGGSITPPKIDASKIPMAAVKDLKSNPASAAQFDEIFGKGASKMVLGK